MAASQPKKPQTSFGLFLGENRDSLMEELKKNGNEKPKITDVTKLASVKWSEMSAAEKEPWENKYKAAKDQFNKDMEDFKQAGGEVVKRGRKEPKDGKAKKDPEMPKKAPTAYGLFYAEKLEETVKANPGKKVTVSEIAKEAGKKWKELSAEEKQPFEEKAKLKAEEQKKAMEEYKQKKDAQQEDAPMEEAEAPEREEVEPAEPEKSKKAAPAKAKAKAKGRGKKAETEDAKVEEKAEEKASPKAKAKAKGRAKKSAEEKEPKAEEKTEAKASPAKAKAKAKGKKETKAVKESKPEDKAKKTRGKKQGEEAPAKAKGKAAAAKAKAAGKAKAQAKAKAKSAKADGKEAKKEKAAPKRKAEPAEKAKKDAQPPAKRGKTAKGASKTESAGTVDEIILKEARDLGYEETLKNLLQRPKVKDAKSDPKAALEALKTSEGLLHPAMRALLAGA